MSVEKVEKGQKYKGVLGDFVLEVMSDPFSAPDGDAWVVCWDEDGNCCTASRVDTLKNKTYFTLIREPKLKVGDRVVVDSGDTVTILATSEKPDADGWFYYFIEYDDGYFGATFDLGVLYKAAE